MRLLCSVLIDHHSLVLLEEKKKRKKENEMKKVKKRETKREWSEVRNSLTKLKCNVVTKKRMGGSERKKEKMGVCGCVRKKKRLAIQHNTTTVHHCLQKKKKKKMKCSNKTTMQMQIIFSTSILYLKTFIIHISRFLFYSFHFTFIRTVRCPNSLSVYSCLSFSLNNSLPRFSCPTKKSWSDRILR